MNIFDHTDLLHPHIQNTTLFTLRWIAGRTRSFYDDDARSKQTTTKPVISFYVTQFTLLYFLASSSANTQHFTIFIHLLLAIYLSTLLVSFRLLTLSISHTLFSFYLQNTLINHWVACSWL